MHSDDATRQRILVLVVLPRDVDGSRWCSTMSLPVVLRRYIDDEEREDFTTGKIKRASADDFTITLMTRTSTLSAN